MSGPWAGPGKERIRADTQVGPYRVDCNTQQAQRNGRGRSPAPTGLSRCAAAGRCGHRPLRKGGGARRGRPGQRRRVERLRHGWEGIAAESIPKVSSNLGQSLSRPLVDSSCCGAQNSLLADRSQNFDRSHSLTSLHLPPAALGSLPLCTREPLALRGTGEGTDIARPSEFPATPGGAGRSPPPTRAPRVPICGLMYLRHGFRQPNFVPKFGWRS